MEGKHIWRAKLSLSGLICTMDREQQGTLCEVVLSDLISRHTESGFFHLLSFSLPFFTQLMALMPAELLVEAIGLHPIMP